MTMATSTTSPFAQAYMRFLHLAKAVDGSPELPTLDANERALLDILAWEWHNATPMTVMQAMAIKQLGSPATLHRRIARLRKLGMIETQEDGHDTRIKRLALTALARAYYDRLGESLRLALGR